MKTPENTAKENWKDVIAHREEVLLEDIEIFSNYLVVEERSNGLNHIQCLGVERRVLLAFGSETYMLYDHKC
jgi:oligopeptidase B